MTDFSKIYSCPYCSNEHNFIYHQGVCPKVKSIEYYENGTTKKVEFHEKKVESSELEIPLPSPNPVPCLCSKNYGEPNEPDIGKVYD